MKLKIIYEDDDVLVIDKPAGIAVHEGIGTEKKKTIADLVKDKIVDQDGKRPGIVHRLDKDTSGILIIAKTTEAKKMLQAQFKHRQVQKVYMALVHGVPKDPEAVLDWPIARHLTHPLKRAVRGGGKEAQTRYKVVKHSKEHSLLKIWPLTGRTHQVRVHLAHLGHPIVGDKLYGHVEEDQTNRQLLHALSTTIKLPNGKKPTFESKLPADFKQAEKELL